ncbi:hypothetical protein D0N36_03350 [Hymenobacter lapidiphilus]|uniref:site-specific integrase n=1 Tax=Hymenobacter sp. CCM 8763 TaxID=2303334 RepID=UPI000E356BB2|nr:site-specific integrase [Hymenobacter sp. CCM 8763]RFP66397.1 hypothetical protein D0N36_03350 [Hymenobacter sp. CCM 8763]
MATTKAYLRATNVHKSALPVGVKYCHQRQWFAVSTGTTIEPEHWDKVKGQAKSTATNAASVNAAISRVAAELQAIADNLAKQGIEPSVEAVKAMQKCHPKAPDASPAVSSVPETRSMGLPFLYHLDSFISSKNGGYSYEQIQVRNRQHRKKDYRVPIQHEGGIFGNNTMKTYYSLYRIIREYQVYKDMVLELMDFDKRMLSDFQAFLVGEKKYLNSSVAKVIKSLKRVLNQLADDDLMPHTKYRRFTLSESKKTVARTVIALTQQEMDALKALPLVNTPGVAYVRDLFILGCSSGLRYSDLVRLQPSHIRNNHIHIEMQKTGEAVAIPLNATSKAILKRYDYTIRRISNVGYNVHLKTLLQLLPTMLAPVERVRWSGAERRSEVVPRWSLVTTHTARRTFINVALESGVSVAVLRSWVGHANLEQLLQYADQNRNAVGEMAKAFC